ncbi:solute carrier family 49 member 4 homolog isoform X1 [Hydra vulgaris]|uniref:Solute carrier family 49 member 4 homolog isoform X1 n=1 Tax=Hydra vulgaris TaxID=6087 RepID=A0ABM4C295_HYDVU
MSSKQRVARNNPSPIVEEQSFMMSSSMLTAVDKVNESESAVKTAVTPMRWFVLFLFSCYVILQYFSWNIFGPISSSVKKTFHWNNTDISMLANWDTILFVIFSMQMYWLVQRNGLRITLLMSLSMMTIGAVFRCIPLKNDWAKWILNTGQIFNGLGGMLAQAAAPFLSSTWFPAKQRTTATAIASLSCPLGIAISHLIGPAFVPDLIIKNESNPFDEQNTASRLIMRTRIEYLMYLEFALSALLLFASIFCFRNKPPYPPSNSASFEKIKFKIGLVRLIKIKDFWLIMAVASSVTGVYSGWGAMLAVNLRGNGLDISQKECGLVGFITTMSSVFGGIMVGKLADRFNCRLKLIIVVLYSIASTTFLWITLICEKIAPFSRASVYISCIIGGFCINGSIPLLFELVVELTYPVPETVSIAFISVVNNLFAFIFLLILGIPNIGVSWMNWCLFAICIMSLGMLFFVSENYKRMKIDEKNQEIFEK